jgi:hypothetical protein
MSDKPKGPLPRGDRLWLAFILVDVLVILWAASL